MAMVLARNWWALALRGVAGIAFGAVAFLWPGITLFALVLMFGVFATSDGVFNVIAAWRARRRERPWGSLLLAGVLGIAAGVISFLNPGMTALALVFVVAAWAFVTGALSIAAAIRLRESIRGEWLLAISGVLSIALGGLLIAFPRAGVLTLVLWLGAYAMVSGAVMLVLGVRLRSFGRARALTGGASAGPPLP